METRAQLLMTLLDGSVSLDRISEDLRRFPWDSDEAFATLGRVHLVNILERYQRGELIGGSVEAWATAVEGRDDIDYESEHEDAVREALHVPANPLLTEQLTMPTAEKFLEICVKTSSTSHPRSNACS